MANQTPVFFVGTSGWTYDHWKGSFYPAPLPKNRWFPFYADRFNTVEVNATFYHFFADATYLKWHDQVDEHFLFTLKAPRIITHRKFLTDCIEDIQKFTRSASILQDRFGLYLLQLAPSTPYDLDKLRVAIEAFGDPTRVAVEFRSIAWNLTEVRNLLNQLGAIYVNVDSPRSRLVDWTTGSCAYFRLHGRRRWYDDDYSTDELHQIASLARKMVRNGVEKVFIYFNNDIHGYAPRNALLLKSFLADEAR